MIKIFFFLSLIIYSIQGYCQIQIAPEIRSIAVLAQFKNSAGSGLYLRDTNQVYFVTAYHVIFNPQTNTPHEDSLTLISYRNDVENDEKSILQISINEAKSTGNIKIDLKNDIAIIKVAILHNIDTLGNASVAYLPYTNKKTRSSKVNFWASDEILKFPDISAGSDIYIVGYPQSLGLQGSFDLDRPLFRKGIVAGKDIRYQRIIGDGAVYFGNSGGAVFELYLERGKPEIKLIGIVSQYIPFNDLLLDTRGNIRSIDAKNSGYSVIIPAERIIQLIHQ